jgi:hypothetical protein
MPCVRFRYGSSNRRYVINLSVAKDDLSWFVANGEGTRHLDARTLFVYAATVNTPAMAMKMIGVGSQYAYCTVDSKGNYLDGSKN